jgi:NAD(P)-dependent dehydrogenase (short-subunit alcohol dehydrogenase family)
VTDQLSTILITGASRGVGLALAECYAARQWNVIATCRDPAQATALAAIARQFDNLSVAALDVADDDAVRDLAHRYSDISIDVLMNNAGMLGDPEAQSIENLDSDLFARLMHTNTFAPLLLATSFLEQVARSQQKKIVALTSGLSSIAFTEHFGRLYFYRASKAALNVAMRALQADIRDRGVTAAVVAPGLVNTDLLTRSGYQGESIEPGQAAENLYEYIENLQPNTAEGFVVPPDKILPW